MNGREFSRARLAGSLIREAFGISVSGFADSHDTFCPMITADRIAKLETALAILLDYIDNVGRYDSSGERLGDQVPAVQQARLVLGEEAWRRIIGEA